jgi:tetratricopeptide (TPR) repeat protein
MQNPSDRSPHEWQQLADTHSKNKDWPQAREALRMALALDGKNRLARSQLALAEMRLGNLAEAEEMFTALIKDKPDDNSQMNLARVLFTGKDYPCALSLLQEAVRVHPDSVPCWRELGTLLDKTGDLQGARAAFETALSLNPSNAASHFLLGQAIIRSSGAWPEARKHFQLAFQYRKTPPLNWANDYLRACLKNNDLESFHGFAGDQVLKERVYYNYDNPDYQRALYGDLAKDPGAYLELLSVANIQPTFRRMALGFADYASSMVNIVDGFRKTVGQPTSAARRVWLMGFSQAFGANFCEDGRSIASFLQSEFNAREGGGEGDKTKVINAGVWGIHPYNACLQIMSFDIHPGDCVIYLFGFTPHRFLKDQSVSAASISTIKFMQKNLSQKGVRFFSFLSPNCLSLKDPTEHEAGICAAYCDLHLEKGCDKGVLRNGELLFYEKLKQEGCIVHDLATLVDRPHDMGEVFVDLTHYNHRLNRRIAEKMFAIITTDTSPVATSETTPVDGPDEFDRRVIKSGINDMGQLAKKNYRRSLDLQRWLRQAREEKFSGLKRIGAIVMNCNPMTLGHLHLIKEALRQVEGLYVFVVEEDKSDFPFADRLAIVQEATVSFPEVAVRPGGHFVISSLTFPEYFSKETAVTKGDPSVDAMLFGAVIAPALGITSRFVGEEPKDIVTQGYNETLAFLLPPQGVELTIVPRLEIAPGQVISAGAVRKALAEGNHSLVKALVPAATYWYLMKKRLLNRDTKERANMEKEADKTLYIHVGAPKTGTKSIQAFATQQREQLLLEYGLYYPHTGNRSSNPTQLERHDSLILADDKVWETLRSEVAAYEPSKVLISYEGILRQIEKSAPQERTRLLEKICTCFPGYHIKIILYLRRFDDQLKSFVNSYFKTPLTSNMARGRQNSLAPYKCMYGNIVHGAMGIAADENEMPVFFGLTPPLIETALKLFGNENFIIRFYNRSSLKNSNVVVDFFDALGIQFQDELLEAAMRHHNNPKMPDGILPFLSKLWEITDMSGLELPVFKAVNSKIQAAFDPAQPGSLGGGGIGLEAEIAAIIDEFEALAPGYKNLFKDRPCSFSWPEIDIDPKELLKFDLLCSLYKNDFGQTSAIAEIQKSLAEIKMAIAGTKTAVTKVQQDLAEVKRGLSSLAARQDQVATDIKRALFPNLMQRLVLVLYRLILKLSLPREQYAVFRKTPEDFLATTGQYPVKRLRKILRFFGPIPPTRKPGK